ncbi:MAG: hypothetical protein GXO15_04380 [Crenarchaeota archaeon]|nr:hypothetical protein [Thermoproteota archaeon]
MRRMSPEEWIALARASLLELRSSAARGPRGRLLWCSSARPTPRGLLLGGCVGSPPPSGSTALVEVYEAEGAPVYTGFAPVEDAGGGLLLASLDLALQAPRPPVQVAVAGYAAPEELASGVDAGLLGLDWLAERLCPTPTPEAAWQAARTLAALVGALLLGRDLVPAPESFAPEARGYITAGEDFIAVEPLVAYVTPSWQPSQGIVGMEQPPPAAMLEIQPGPRLERRDPGCRWAVKL